MTFKKGDIIWPIERTQNAKKLRHPAVVWDNEVNENNDLMGIMLSSKGPDKYPKNFLMKPKHFRPGFYNNTHFVNQRFIKFAHWGPFEKVGALTKEGIAYIEERLSTNCPIPFDEYLQKQG